MSTNSSRGAVLVTGTDTGIGAACAEHLSGLGFQVFAGVIDQASLESLQASRGSRMTLLELDVSNPEHVAAAAESIGETVGDAGLSGVVNNAGYAIGGPLEHLPIDVFRRNIEVNLMGQIAIVQAMLPLLRRGGGRIVNLGSPSGTFVLPFLSPYAASKAAIKATTEALRMELSGSGVSVSLIEPGRVLTEIWQRSTDDSTALVNQYSKEAVEQYGHIMLALATMNNSAAGGGFPPKRIARVVEHALTARRPRARYYVGLDCLALSIAAHIVPTRLRDFAVRRAIARFVSDEPLNLPQ